MRLFLPLVIFCGLFAGSEAARAQERIKEWHQGRYLKEPDGPNIIHFNPGLFMGEDPPDTVGPWMRILWAGPRPPAPPTVYFMARYPFPLEQPPGATRWDLLKLAEISALLTFSRPRKCIGEREVEQAEREARVSLIVDFHEKGKVAFFCGMSSADGAAYLADMLKLSTVDWRNHRTDDVRYIAGLLESRRNFASSRLR